MAVSIERFVQVMSPGARSAKPGSVVAYAKSRLSWLDATKRVSSDIARLRSALQSDYADDDDAPALLEAFDERVAPVLQTFDEALADKLDEAVNATDPNARQKLVEEARALIGRYTEFLATDDVIAGLDENPFVRLSIRSSFGSTLKGISEAVY
jgi:hypothetical protein